MVARLARWVDDRLGVGGWARRALNKAFPDHWSFLLGEIAMYCFAVLVATGLFLTLFFRPSTAPVVYDGSYAPMRGVEVTQAYASVLDLSFDVRAGLLVRQVHHWAAVVFVAAIVVHLLEQRPGGHQRDRLQYGRPDSQRRPRQQVAGQGVAGVAGEHRQQQQQGHADHPVDLPGPAELTTDGPVGPRRVGSAVTAGVRPGRVVRLAAACSVAASAVVGCRAENLHPPAAVPDGNPALGREAIVRYGCGSCHLIPGVPQADSNVAPPLVAWSERAFVGGRLANTPGNLMRWIMNPQDVDPGSPMPNLDVTEADARHIAAYLLTLGT